ncbi:MAG: hypothetical protein ACXAB7_07240 [Candidatus Kariarchaeaceae archaeon]|jgi:hypothetical protein
MDRKTIRVRWIPGFQRPNFIFYRIRVTLPTKIPPSFIYAAIFLSILYVYSGGVYDLVEKPFARGADSQGNPVLIWPDQDRQFLIEGIVAGILMFLGAGGLYMLSQATADPHNPSRASTFQTIGVVMILISFLILQSMFKTKTG